MKPREAKVGGWVDCPTCGGSGIEDRGYLEVSPEECRKCVNGQQWRYPSGVIALYRGGPLCGREAARAS